MPDNRIIYQDENVVVRLTYKPDGTYFVMAHQLADDGQECLPLGYWLGSNGMTFVPKAKSEARAKAKIARAKLYGLHSKT